MGEGKEEMNKYMKLTSDNFKFRVWDEVNQMYDTDGFLLDGRTGQLVTTEEGYEIEPCTGVRCRSTGKLIYKGDIVRRNYPGAPPNVVDWNPKTCRWVVRAIKDVGMTEAASFCDDSIYPTDGYVIIGNIHR